MHLYDAFMRLISTICLAERWGLGSRPKKMYGERLGDGVEYHLIALRPVVKYHLRRGVGLIKFLEMVLDPSPPPLVWRQSATLHAVS